MGFEAFDTSKQEEYAERAKKAWDSSPEWSEYEKKRAGRTQAEEVSMGEQLMALFVPFGRMAAEGTEPSSAQALAQAATIQQFITDHFYTCTNETFAQLGRAYGAGGEFSENIDAAAGPGAAAFAAQAVAAFCAQA